MIQFEMPDFNKPLGKMIMSTAGGVAVGFITGYWVGSSSADQPDTSMYDATLDAIRRSILALRASKNRLENHGLGSDVSILFDSDAGEEDPLMRDDHLEVEVPVYSGADNFPAGLVDNKTMMAKYLSQELYEAHCHLATNFGTTLDDCIQTGIDNPGKSGCGIVAGDEECYDLFSAIFDSVIGDRHRTWDKYLGQDRDLSIQGLEPCTFDPKYVLSVHFLVGRCLKGFRFLPMATRVERRRVEMLLKQTLEALTGEFAGKYTSLSDLSQERNAETVLPDLVQSILLKPNSSTLQTSNSNRDWPEGRGVFYSEDNTVFAWTNREDHLRVMYRNRDTDMLLSFQRFTKCMKEIEFNLHSAALEFTFHPTYGHLLTCPSGIGTAFRVGVHMKIPQLIKHDRFKRILRHLRLHITYYEGSDNHRPRGFVDVYNADRLGHTENQLVQIVCRGVQTLIDMEKELEAGNSIEHMLRWSSQTSRDDASSSLNTDDASSRQNLSGGTQRRDN